MIEHARREPRAVNGPRLDTLTFSPGWYVHPQVRPSVFTGCQSSPCSLTQRFWKLSKEPSKQQAWRLVGSTFRSDCNVFDETAVVQSELQNCLYLSDLVLCQNYSSHKSIWEPWTHLGIHDVHLIPIFRQHIQCSSCEHNWTRTHPDRRRIFHSFNIYSR